MWCYLLGLVLLLVAWRDKAVCVDALIARGRLISWCGSLHGQKRLNALDLTRERAVSQSLSLGRQTACGHPFAVLLLLHRDTQMMPIITDVSCRYARNEGNH